MSADAAVANYLTGSAPVISQAVSSVQLAEDGDLAQAANEAYGLRQTVQGFQGDPLHALISEGLGFLISVVQPLEDMIEMVTGDSEALSGSAGQFGALADDMISLAEETAGMLDEGIASWQGEASAAARQRLAAALAAVKATGGEANQVKRVLELSAAVMAAAESAIRDILATLVEWLIITWLAALASAAVTFGASTAAASSATTVEASIATSRAARIVRKVMSIIRRIMNVLRRVIGKIGELAKPLTQAARKAYYLDGGLGGHLADSLWGSFKGGVRSVGAVYADQLEERVEADPSSDATIEYGLRTGGETGG